MGNKAKTYILILLCAVILISAVLSARAVVDARNRELLNPNVTRVTTPEQEDFEIHPDWTIPETEPVDYGENLALGKSVKQSSQTQIYNGKNVTDGDRFTYWEGMSNSYPNSLTIDLESVQSLTGARILLNPRQIWGARTQEVEILVSSDGETFTTVAAPAQLSFDPMEDNSVYVPFGENVSGQYVQFIFTANSGATAGQAAEIEIYGQQ